MVVYTTTVVTQGKNQTGQRRQDGFYKDYEFKFIYTVINSNIYMV